MKKILLWFLILLVLSFFGVFIFLWNKNIRIKPEAPIYEVVTLNLEKSKVSIIADIADSLAKRATGLMGRKQMGEYEGMLFIFPSDVQHGFWMKDTLIPLDMIFIDSSLTVVDIISNVPICITDTCRTYTPSTSYRYVLEVNSGFATKHGVTIGEKVSFDYK